MAGTSGQAMRRPARPRFLKQSKQRRTSRCFNCGVAPRGRLLATAHSADKERSCILKSDRAGSRAARSDPVRSSSIRPGKGAKMACFKDAPPAWHSVQRLEKHALQRRDIAIRQGRAHVAKWVDKPILVPGLRQATALPTAKLSDSSYPSPMRQHKNDRHQKERRGDRRHTPSPSSSTQDCQRSGRLSDPRSPKGSYDCLGMASPLNPPTTRSNLSKRAARSIKGKRCAASLPIATISRLGKSLDARFPYQPPTDAGEVLNLTTIPSDNV